MRPEKRKKRSKILWRREGASPFSASENSDARELLLAQIRRFPAKDGHGDAVASIQVSFHLNLQIVEGIEAQVIVESFLIAAVTALDFAVMPRCSRTDRPVRNAVFLAEQIQRMHTLRFCGVGKFAAVVCLQRLRRIAETGERASQNPPSNSCSALYTHR